MKNKMNKEVTAFLEELNHPLIQEISLLRKIILETDAELQENIKWNGPNYLHNNDDRITMRIHPPKQIQLIFHRGAKVKQQPKKRLISDETGLLVWKENDRAVVSFKNEDELKKNKKNIQKWIQDWTLAGVESNIA
ncbi:MAG TPA: DUF1801 domain-containing protein [Leptospiraceae bacterium]|nr:DUF1801 domain-containing protein [Leptospiraceae bacterium]HMZ58759.1 DUF1801 domain-containing protein [Leptospiraceae bacterium]HNF15310.1 DUF1801 domain-containing protein [Leptospiraceae bacterium]HNF27049.1 DUF1801 domain-containing protein [Leptospiraceae bacterium]HNH07851.1 DUF1801 domain-containing protein [Leptospiraceae bacterium]